MRLRWMGPVILLAFVAAVAALWWLGSSLQESTRRSSEPGSRQARGSPPRRPDAGPPGPERDLADMAPPVVAREASAALRPESEHRGPGAATLRFLDGASGEPVADLPFLVYSERPTLHTLLQGRSDAAGEVRFEELPEDVVIVTTLRRPPLAATTFAFWSAPGERRVEDIRIGRGGTLRGRVVDHAGQPVAGQEVQASERGPEEQASGARSDGWRHLRQVTDASGRFRFDHLLSRPAGIWLVEGAMRPERLDPVWLRVDPLAQRAQQVLEGDDVDVGDLVLPAPPGRLLGRVVDPSGQPIGGALVSGNFHRRRLLTGTPTGTAQPWATGPGEPGFALQEQEKLTDAAGRFEWDEFRGIAMSLFVWTRADQRQVFSIELPPEGESIEREFRVDVQDRLQVEITGRAEDGSAVPLARDVSYCLTRSSGEFLRGRRGPDAAGRFEIRFPYPAAEVAQLHLDAEGWWPVAERFDSGLSSGHLLRYAMQPEPIFTLRIRLLPHPADPGPVEPKVYLQVRACKLGPPRDPDRFESCCGYGFRYGVERPLEPDEIELQVKEDAPFWLWIQGPGAIGRSAPPLFAFGPFRPDGEVHDVQLPALEAMEPTPPSAPTHAAAEAPLSDELPLPGSLRLIAVDAADGQPLAGQPLVVTLRRSGWNRSRGIPRTADAEGSVTLTPLDPGSYEVEVACSGFQPQKVSLQLGPKEKRFLGSIALTRKQMIPVHVRHPAGVEVPARHRDVVSLWTSEGFDEFGVGLVAGEGEFEGPVLPPLEVLVRCDLVGDQYQTFASVSETGLDIELAMAPAVQIDVGGLGREALPENLWIGLIPATGRAPTAVDKQDQRAVHGDELLPDPDGTRHIRFRVLPGAYFVVGARAGITLTPQRIDVASSAEFQIFRVSF